jgi:hypothetical protein
MSENKCPVVIRVEGGWLSEIGDAFVSSLGDNYTGHHVPEGSVILLGSLSDLMSQGPQGHAKSLCAEVRRLNGMFHNSVSIVPFVPVPLFGTNSASLVMGIMDITDWLNTVQKPSLSGYNNAVKSHILASVWGGGEGENVTMIYPPHPLVLPDNVGIHRDQIFTCNGVPDLPTSVPPMSCDSESSLYSPLFEGLNVIYKWNLDTSITINREISVVTMDEPAATSTDVPIIMVGGSNAGRLGMSLDNIGRPTVDVTSSGWSLTPANVNIIKALLEAECITKPDSPVVIYALDNSCFMNMSADGTISPIKKLEDGKYHVVGDLAITPGILLRPMYAALEEIIKLCGNRRIYILTPLPRYILVPCCELDSHCVNLIVKDDATRQGVFDLMDELEMIGRAVSIKFAACTVINTGDLLAGKTGATRHEVLDAMIAHWMSDPVHGTKTGYSKLATKLADRVDADSTTKNMVKKTVAKKRAASPEAGSSNSSSHGSSSSRNVRGRGGLDTGRRDSGGYNYNPGTHPNQRGSWLPGFTRGGNRGGSGRGRGRGRNYQ